MTHRAPMIALVLVASGVVACGGDTTTNTTSPTTSSASSGGSGGSAGSSSSAGGGDQGGGGSGGTGGEQTGGAGGAGGQGGAAGSCDNVPAPVGMLDTGGCTLSYNTQTMVCEKSCKDDDDNAYKVVCDPNANSCECLYNDQVVCACSAMANSTCQGHCCPTPWAP